MSTSGIPLVFIHAFPLSSRMWDVNKPAFERNFRFITVDLPGFGAAPPAGETSTMEGMARHVLQTLDQINIREKFVVAGLSMGGYVMLQLLRLAPERVRAAAFLSTRAAADSPEAREKRLKNIAFVQKEGSAAFAERMIPGLVGKTTLSRHSGESRNPGLKLQEKTWAPAFAGATLIDQIKSWIAAADPNAIVAALRGMAERPDSGAVLDSLKAPALFLAGEEDNVVPPSEMEAMSKRVPQGLFQLLPQAGHLINLEKPVLFNEAFLHFLKSRVL